MKPSIKSRIGLVISMIVMVMMVQELTAQKRGTRISNRNGVSTFNTNHNGERLEVEYDGRIEFSDDDKSIKSMSNNAYMRIRKSGTGGKREILAEMNSGGNIEYEYYESRRKSEFDADAKEWFSEVLLEVIRGTGIGAEGRVERFMTKGGVQAVLDEVDEIRGDYVSHIYLGELLYANGLKDDDLVKVAGYVPKKLDSDYYISEVFKDHGDMFLKNDKSAEAFLSAMKRMDSDYYISEILKSALREELSAKAMDKVLENVMSIGSDYYKSEVLQDVLDWRPTKEQIMSVLNSVEDINSDYYKSEVLKSGCKLVSRSDDDVKSSFRKAARAIRSDTYYGKVSRCID